MAHIVEGSHSFTCITTHLSTNGMNHTCLCLPRSAFRDLGAGSVLVSGERKESLGEKESL